MYMKVSQNEETNPDTQPIRPPRIPNLSNSQLSPSGSFARKRGTPGYFPGCFSPSPVSPLTALGHPEHRYLSCYASLCICLLKYLLFLPPLLSLDTETNAVATQYDYGVDDPSLLPEQPGKPPPLDHQISPTLLYTACIRVV